LKHVEGAESAGAIAYPDNAWTAGEEGNVVVDVCIDEDGKPTKVTAVSGPSMLSTAVVGNLREKRYRPLYDKERHDGRSPTPACFKQYFSFRRTVSRDDLTSPLVDTLVTRNYEQPQKEAGPLPKVDHGDRRSHPEGVAEVRICISAEGVPEDVTVLRAVPAEFGNRAQTAVREWRFKPGLLRGERVPACVVDRFYYVLK
jgi:TonB family protein